MIKAYCSDSYRNEDGRRDLENIQNIAIDKIIFLLGIRHKIKQEEVTMKWK